MITGLDLRCKEPVTRQLLAWAEVICVMGKSHRNKLRIGEAWRPKDFHLPNDLKGPDARG